MNAPLYYLFIFLATGIILEGFMSLGGLGWLLVGGAACAASFFIKKRLGIFFLIVACIALGGAVCTLSPETLSQKHWEKVIRNLDAKPVWVEGRVTRHLRQGITKRGRPTSSFILRSDSPIKGNVQVYLSGGESVIRYGDRFKIQGVLEHPRGQRNPAGFNQKKYLASINCYVILRANKINKLPSSPWDLTTGFYRLKNRLLDQLDAHLNPDNARTAKALFLGDRSDLDRGFRSELVSTGTMHLFAISGLHVGLVLAFFLILFNQLGFPDRPKNLLLIGILIFYCILVGANPPAVRATLMACVYLGAKLLMKKASIWNTIGLAGNVLLLLNPSQIYNIGFQLSFTAVLGLSWVIPHLTDLSGLHHEKKLFFGKSLLLTSFAAWMVTAPLTIHYFHHLHLLSPILNMILIPAVFILNIFFFIFCVMSLLPFGLETAAAFVINKMIEGMTALVHYFDGLVIFKLLLPSWSSVTWLLITAGFVWILHTARFKSKSIRFVSLLLVFLNSVFFDSVLAMAKPQPYRITFFDVGQGDSILFEFPRRGTLLVDTGPGFGQRENIITPYLHSRGLGHLDAVVISHPQFDHCGALSALMGQVNIHSVFDNGQGSETEFYKELSTLMDHVVVHQTITKGDELKGFGDTQIEVLHPGRDDGLLDVNNQSIVLRIDREGFSTLLTGDLEEEGVLDLLRVIKGSVQLLKVPHHGADVGRSGLLLLRQLRPEISVIQVGRKNRYRHPHSNTVEYLNSLSGRVLRTDRDAAIQLERTKDGSFKIRTWSVH
jgi:competence protein ComEC